MCFNLFKLKLLLCNKQCKDNERQATDLKKIFAKDTSNKGLFSKIYQEHIKFNKTTDYPIKQWIKELNRHLTKKDI